MEKRCDAKMWPGFLTDRRENVSETKARYGEWRLVAADSQTEMWPWVPAARSSVEHPAYEAVDNWRNEGRPRNEPNEIFPAVWSDAESRRERAAPIGAGPRGRET